MPDTSGSARATDKLSLFVTYYPFGGLLRGYYFGHAVRNAQPTHMLIPLFNPLAGTPSPTSDPHPTMTLGATLGAGIGGAWGGVAPEDDAKDIGPPSTDQRMLEEELEDDDEAGGDPQPPRALAANSHGGPRPALLPGPEAHGLALKLLKYSAENC